jgi:hypothetical protein
MRATLPVSQVHGIRSCHWLTTADEFGAYLKEFQGGDDHAHPIVEYPAKKRRVLKARSLPASIRTWADLRQAI